jgi:hypothetical protein
MYAENLHLVCSTSLEHVESRTGAVALVFRWHMTRLSPVSPQSGLAWPCFLFPLIGRVESRRAHGRRRW